MHYKNGREAKQGDVVVNVAQKQFGILHTLNAQSDTCNGRLAMASPNDPWVNIKDCLHIDDIAAVEIPDVLKG
jgi:hypothetical protein